MSKKRGNPSSKEVADAFKDNPSIVVGEDSSLFYCPDAPFKRDIANCPPRVDAANPPKKGDPRNVKQKSPTTSRLQTVFNDSKVRSSEDGTITYCTEAEMRKDFNTGT